MKLYKLIKKNKVIRGKKNPPTLKKTLTSLLISTKASVGGHKSSNAGFAMVINDVRSAK